MINRIEPNGPPGAYKTYQIAAPVSTHYRTGTCDEAGCLAQRHGWQTTVDESTDLGQRQAHYIRRLSGRRYVERRTEAGLTAFTFEAGQTCFAEHKIPLDREEFYAVRDGDWRHLGGPRLHTSPDAWVDDFGEHQDRLKRAIEG